MSGPLEPNFGFKEQKRLMGYTTGNEALEPHFPKLSTFSKSVEPSSRNHDPNMTQNEHVYVIAVISGHDVKTVEGYNTLNSEVDSSNSFWDFP